MNLTRAVVNCVRVLDNFGSLWMECVNDPEKKIRLRLHTPSPEYYWIEYYYKGELRTQMIDEITAVTEDECIAIERFIVGSGLDHLGEWRFYESTRENIQEFIDILKTWLEKPDAEFKDDADV